MNKPKVSIVVPVYNAEFYLRKCIDSLLNQSYSDLELVLVDDDSTDGSVAICDEYGSKYGNVKVIHKQNGGLSDARNCGLDNCTGDYAMFVDSDDYLAQRAVEVMVNTLLSTGARIVCMKSYIVNHDYSIRFNQSNNTETVTITTSEDYIDGICHKKMSESVCDKLFPIDTFDKHRFVKGRLNEDFLFLSGLLMEHFKIAIVDFSGYYYYQRKGSISHSGFGKSLVDSVANGYELLQEAENSFPKTIPSFTRYTLFQIRTLFITIPWKLVSQNSKEYKDSYKILNTLRADISGSDLSKIDKMFLKGILFNPKMAILIFKLLYKIKNVI